MIDLHALTEGLAPDTLVPVDVAHLGIPDDCLLSDLGIVPTHVGRGRCRATMTVRRGHLNQRGTAHGGALVAFADAAAGWASYTATADGRFTTADLACHFLRAVDDGETLVAEAEPVHLGRRMLVLDVRVGTTGRQVAKVTCTQLVLSS